MGGGAEHAGACADVRHHQDRGEEDHDRAEVPERVLGGREVQLSGGQHRGRRSQADGGLGATARVAVRREEQDDQRDHRHQVEEGSHGRNLRHL